MRRSNSRRTKWVSRTTENDSVLYLVGNTEEVGREVSAPPDRLCTLSKHDRESVSLRCKHLAPGDTTTPETTNQRNTRKRANFRGWRERRHLPWVKSDPAHRGDPESKEA